MDTRAWRLPLARGEGSRWIEVDQERVLSAKLALLAKAGAQTSHLSDSDACMHRLRCGSYHAVGVPPCQRHRRRRHLYCARCIWFCAVHLMMRCSCGPCMRTMAGNAVGRMCTYGMAR